MKFFWQMQISAKLVNTPTWTKLVHYGLFISEKSTIELGLILNYSLINGAGILLETRKVNKLSFCITIFFKRQYSGDSNCFDCNFHDVQKFCCEQKIFTCDFCCISFSYRKLCHLIGTEVINCYHRCCEYSSRMDRCCSCGPCTCCMPQKRPRQQQLLDCSMIDHVIAPI